MLSLSAHHIFFAVQVTSMAQVDATLGDRLLGTLWRSGSNCELLRPIQRSLVVGAWPPCKSVTCGLPLGREFPSSFESLVKEICKYLFHVSGHIYWAL